MIDFEQIARDIKDKVPKMAKEAADKPKRFAPGEGVEYDPAWQDDAAAVDSDDKQARAAGTK